MMKCLLCIVLFSILQANSSENIDSYNFITQLLNHDENAENLEVIEMENQKDAYKLKGNSTVIIKLHELNPPLKNLETPFEIYANIELLEGPSHTIFIIRENNESPDIYLNYVLISSLLLEITLDIMGEKISFEYELEANRQWVNLIFHVEKEKVDTFVNCKFLHSTAVSFTEAIKFGENSVFILGKFWSHSLDYYTGVISDLQLLTNLENYNRDHICNQFFAEINGDSSFITGILSGGENGESEPRVPQGEGEQEMFQEKGDLIEIKSLARGLDNTKGQKGDKGDVGPPGANAELNSLLDANIDQDLYSKIKKRFKGDKGDKGSTGLEGKGGPQGLKGEKGDNGMNGIAGTPGSNGTNGDKGDKGDVGPPGANAELKSLLDANIDQDLYSKIKKRFKGDKGDKGTTGREGKVGPQGLMGEKGDNGINGIAGTPGSNGTNGDKGDKGDVGPPGANAELKSLLDANIDQDLYSKIKKRFKGDKGDKGTTGREGKVGPQGLMGEKGDNGINGIAGTPGSNGTNGDKGDKGDVGPPGANAELKSLLDANIDQDLYSKIKKRFKGDKGDKGATGREGKVGPQGRRGEKGDNGINGIAGTPGSNGTNGDKGDKGDVGPPGANAELKSLLDANIDQDLYSKIKKRFKGDKGDKGTTGREGKVGPQGLMGEKGDNGINGIAGTPGSNGTNGDKGDKGDVGPPGANAELKSLLDANIDQDLYSKIKKRFKGDKGDKGATGPEGKYGSRGPIGEKGGNGIRGIPGIPGFNGTKGERGFKGDKGPPGANAELQSLLDPNIDQNLYANITKRFKGDKGDKGETGHKGKGGSPGQKGEKGENGIHGIPGIPGLNGTKGERGDKGDKGPPGANAELQSLLDPNIDQNLYANITKRFKGDKGDKGAIGHKGVPGDPGPIGLKGDMGVPGKDGEKGQKGEIGPSGLPGNVSITEIGLTKGPKGEPGEKGEQGSRGVPGHHGKTGSRGLPGLRGPKGEPGRTGSQGPRGDKGEKGLPGPKGEKGVMPFINLEQMKGDKGDKGETGKPGTPGVVGPPGVCEVANVTGFRGPQGPPGPPGPPGTPGISIVGPKGEPGAVLKSVDSFNYDDEDVEIYEATVIIIQTRHALVKLRDIPMGRLVFIIQEGKLIVRVMNKWQPILMNRKKHSVETPIEQPSTPTQTIQTVEATSTEPHKHTTKRPINVQNSMRIIALNKPYPGNMLSSFNRTGKTAVDLDCYNQGKKLEKYSTFAAFVSTNSEYLREVIKRHEHRGYPIVNMYYEPLFDSWKSMFDGSGAEFANNIYSFSGKNIILDKNWPIKAVWHGSNFDGVRKPSDTCTEWTSNSRWRYGVASELSSRRLLDQHRYSCDNELIVLCVEINKPRYHRSIRHNRLPYL